MPRLDGPIPDWEPWEAEDSQEERVELEDPPEAGGKLPSLGALGYDTKYDEEDWEDDA